MGCFALHRFERRSAHRYSGPVLPDELFDLMARAGGSGDGVPLLLEDGHHLGGPEELADTGMVEFDSELGHDAPPAISITALAARAAAVPSVTA